MTEKYIDLAERIKRDRDTGPITGLDGETYALRWLDEHPDQVPGRTITESELESQLSIGLLGEEFLVKITLKRLGITVVPDPEPTNAEKLAEALRGTNHAHGSDLHDIKGLSEALDKAGVKAPGGDDEQR